ncbi:MAG: hypothetical protein N4A46_12460 [Schleiferiaceae bacterium]|jgi:hypothetical protein|nr:hypothetical protein [Schleiferiaceae bacterium]
MKRIQLFEFEDFSWFPDWLRGYLTNLIVILQKWMGLAEVQAKEIKTILQQTGLSQIVDLGSGSGGSMPDVLSIIRNDPEFSKVALRLTDKYPSPSVVKKYEKDGNPNIEFSSESIDATHLENAPKGLKTMMNCFHHMPPNQAKAILKSAADSKQPIFIYEMAENKIPLIVWCLMLPLSLVMVFIMCLFMTPFIRLLSLKQIIFTYIIPIVPITYAWDGQASMPRMYSFSDLDELLKSANNENYSWEKRRLKKDKGKNAGTCLIGLPLNR